MLIQTEILADAQKLTSEPAVTEEDLLVTI